MTGAAPIKDEEVATLISQRIDTEVAYVEKPLSFFDKDSAMLEKIKASGLEEEKFAKGDFERLAGREPETFEEYLSADHRMTVDERKALGLADFFTMTNKIELDFPSESHFVTLVPKTEETPAETAQPVAAQ